MPQVQELTVGLRFTADTQIARQQLNTLKQDLNNLATMKNINIGDGMSESLLNASNAAAQLKVQLQEATNVKTGNLDLSKFNYSLKQSGMTLEKYKQQLFALGSDGEKAFFQLASSIQSAEIPLLRINKLFTGLWDNLKRTAGWQFSSTAIHAVMGAVQKAYGYAQDLNRSLNDIRIVTGQSADQMARFAEVANKSAKALSTTTNEYVKASLIYYQQGLSDSEVQARTDVTVKMANVTRESAETVSDQMTAVWNNFAKGGENLESFADKMVALGAATASSSDEIAQGLEKFAAVADTVGLSFDYAAAALTTITATTRQSADTVGTALKTLFARMEGLKLGETLEDGTDLNKYSEALASIGVNIKDTNGEIKQMDTILDETMGKWKTLSKDQQIALAQTVAGVRQYTQFVALMDNADFFKENLATEAGSSGALQEQADIYAESWEAAQKRVKAASESVYSDLLDDKFFIKLTNNFAKLIEGIDKFIDSLGGLKGLLPGITALVLKIGGDKIATNIERSANGLKRLITGGAAEKALKNEAANISFNENKDSASYVEQAQGTYYANIQKAQAELTKHASKMSDAELRINEIYMDRLKALNQINIDRAKEYEIAEKQERVEKRDLHVLQKQGIDNINKNNIDDIGAGIVENYDKLDFSHLTSEAEIYQEKLNLINKTLAEQEQAFTTTAQSVGNFDACYDELIDAVQQYNNAQNSGSEEAKVEATDRLRKAYKELADAGQNLDKNIQLKPTYEELEKNTNKVDELVASYDKISTSGMAKMNQQGEKLSASYTKMGIASDKAQKKVDSLGYSITQQTKASAVSAKAENIATKATDKYIKSLTKAKAQVSSFGKSIVAAARAMSQVMTAVNSLSSAVQTLNDPDMSTWEKFTSVLMSVSVGIPSLISGFSQLGKAITGFHTAGGFAGIFNSLGSLQGNILNSSSAIGTLTTSILKNNQAMTAGNVLREMSIALGKAKEGEDLKEIVLSKLKEAGLDQEANKIILVNIAKKLGISINEKESASKIASAIASELDAKAKDGEAAATLTAGAANTFFLGTLLPLLPIILAIGVAIAALVAGIYLLVKAYNKENDALKESNENLKQAKEMAEKTASEYKNLKDKIEALNDAKDTLKDLKKGTIEWAEAVADINGRMLELLELYPELAKYTTINTDGIYSFTKQGTEMLSLIQAQKLQAMQIAQINEIMEQSTNTRVSSDKMAIDSAKMITNYDNNMIKYLVPTILSSALPYFGIYGALATTIGEPSLFAQQKETDTLNNQIQIIADKIYKDKNLSNEEKTLLLKNDTQFDQYINSLGKQMGLSTEATKELTSNLHANNNQLKNTISKMIDLKNAGQSLNESIGKQIGINVYDQVAGDFISSQLAQQGLNSPGAKDQIVSILAEANKVDIAKAYQEEMDKYYSKRESGWRLTNEELSEYLGTTIVNNDDLIRRYAIASGLLTDTQAQKASYQKTKTGLSLSLGGEEVVSATEDSAKKLLWEQQAYFNPAQSIGIDAKATEIQIKQLVNIRKKAVELGEKFGTDFTDAVSNSLSTGEIDLSSAILDADISDFENMQLMSADELAKAFGITELSQETLKELGYDSAHAWGEAFKEELSTYSAKDLLEHQLDQIKAEAEAAGLEGEDAANYAQTLMDVASANDILADSLEKDAKAAGVVAQSVMLMNDGIEELAKNQEDWLDVLDKSNETSEEFAKALGGIRTAMSKILGIDGTYLSKEFLTNAENIELMKKAAEGDAEAIDALKAKLKDEVILKIIADNEIENSNELLAAHADLQNQLKDLEVGATLNTDNFLIAAQKFIDDAGMTVEQAQAYFDSLGYQAEIEPVEADMTSTREATGLTPEVTFHKAEYGGGLSDGAGKVAKWLIGTLSIPKITWKNDPKGTAVSEDSSTIQAASIGQAGKVQKPKIKGVTKKATGSMNNYSSSNAGGPSPTGKSSNEKERTPKKARDEIDRYHEVNQVLDDLSKKMEELSTLKDRAWGGKRIAAIRAERQALEEYGTVLNQKLAEAESYLQQDASMINAYGARYDAQGRVINYNQIIENAVAAYNSGSIEEEEYNDIKTKLQHYEDSLNTRQQLLYESAENARKILDSKFEEVEYAIQIRVEIDDRQIAYIEWLVKHLENQAFKEAETVAMASQNFDNMMTKWGDYARGIHDILITAGASEGEIAAFINGDAEAISNLTNLTDEAIEQLGNYTDGLRNTYDDLVELKELIENQLEKVYDDWNDKIEHQLDLMDHYDSILSHYQNIVDIIGAAPLGMTSENLINLAKSQVDAALKTTEAIKANWELQEKELATAREELAKATTEKDIAYWQNEIERLETAVVSAEEKFYASWEETMQRAADLYQKTLEQAIKGFENSISPTFRTFEEAQELLNQQKTLSEQYIPEYQKLYELNKLRRQINQDLEKTDNLSAQKKLNDLQDEINQKMAQGVKLSKYDLDYLQKKYNLRLAEIALEEAQNAKSRVRLRRDSNGNYNYIYTADEDKINDSVQNYEDKLYDIQNLTENYLNELSEAYISTMSEMTQALANIHREDYANEQDYMAKIDQVKNYYMERLNYYTSEINKALSNNQQLYLEDKNFTDRVYTDKENRQRSFITEFHETLVGGILQGYDNIEDATDKLEQSLGTPGNSNTLIGKMCQNYNDWYKETNKVLKLNKTSFDMFSKDLYTIINGSNGIIANLNSMKNTVNNMAKEAQYDYAATAKAISNFQRETSPKLQQLKAETEAYTVAHLNLLVALATKIVDPHNTSTYTVINETIQRTTYETSGTPATQPVTQPVVQPATQPSDYVSQKTVWIGTTPFQSGIAHAPTQQQADTTALNEAKWLARNALKDYTIAADGYITETKAKPLYLYQEKKSGKYMMYSANDVWLLRTHKYITKFNTGGYTGDWGSEGRLAMLHEKELVLNKNDTSNMLQAVNIVRDLAKSIDLTTQSNKNSLGQLSAIKLKGKNDNEILNSQNITIYADFPGVTVEQEIQKAFDDMSLQALQYAFNDNKI